MVADSLDTAESHLVEPGDQIHLDSNNDGDGRLKLLSLDSFQKKPFELQRFSAEADYQHVASLLGSFKSGTL